jgi:hypothetical protein
MCLDIVNAVYKKPLQAPRIAYKYFRVFKNCVEFPVKCSKLLIFNSWMPAEISTRLVSTRDGKVYLSGFHCFQTTTDAEKHWLPSYHIDDYENLALSPVVIQNISAAGIERCALGDCSTLIAQKMYVPKSFKDFGEALEECHAEIARLKEAKKKHTNVKKESSKCIAQNAVTKISRKKTSICPPKTSGGGTTTASRATGRSCAKSTGSKKTTKGRQR